MGYSELVQRPFEKMTFFPVDPLPLATPERAHNATMSGLIHPEEHDNLPNHPPPNKINKIKDKSIANVFSFGAFANKVTGVVYNGCTGNFPCMSLDGNGMVHAWVAQKTLKRDILRVFTMSDLLNI